MLALYIHVPYCLEKCPYCDFHSIATKKQSIPEKNYADCLTKQLEWEVDRFGLKDRPLLSIFFGGGTPSLMSPDFFRQVFEAVSRRFTLSKDIEITVETNPATASKANFREWFQIGINRISFGVQSFQDSFLKKLGRNHTSEQARLAIENALSACFSNLSLDLIFGIEGQRVTDLEKDLQTALSFDLPHISAYQLTVEPATPLASWVGQGKFTLPEEGILVQMHQMVSQMLEEEGLNRYEISNYAKPGFESRHNLQYWRYGDYLGIGSGAVSFVNGKRWRTTRKLKHYLSCKWDYEDEEIIDAKISLKEKWMMGLRLAEGVSLGYHNEDWYKGISKWEDGGFLKKVKGRIQLTPKGFLFCNQVIQDIFDLMDKV